MAELFGVAAGAAGMTPVIVEAAASIKKLHSFCRDVKEAPEEVHKFVDEVHDITALLQQMEELSSLSALPASAGLRACFDHCNRANHHLSGIVSELQAKMNTHRTISRLTFPLKAERLHRLTRRLERAKTSLLLALNIHMMCHSRVQAQIQQQLLCDVISLIQTQERKQEPTIQVIESPTWTRAPPDSRRANTFKQQDHKIWAAMSLSNHATSLMQRFWEVCMSAAMSGWKRCLRSYNVHPWDAPAFQLCRDGDLLGLQRALCAGKITLQDQTIRGETLFTTALVFRQVHVARELAIMGADVTSTDRFGDSPLTCFWTSVFCSGLSSRQNLEDVRDSLKFFIDECDLEADSAVIESEIETFLKPALAWGAEEILELIRSLLLNGRIDLKTLLLLASECPLAQFLSLDHSDLGTRLLHFVSRECARRWTPDGNIDAMWTSSIKLAKEGTNGNIHVRQYGRTPLQTFLANVLVNAVCRDLRNVKRAALSWLNALEMVGVDLQVYGREESLLWRFDEEDLLSRPRILGFHHGVKAVDWNVFVEHPGDRYAGIFWDLVDRPAQRSFGWWKPEQQNMIWEDRFFARAQWLRESRKKVDTNAPFMIL